MRRTLLFFTVLALLTVVLSGSVFAQTQYADIITLAESGDYERALLLLRRLKQQDPNNYEHTRMEALVYRHMWMNLADSHDPEEARAIQVQSIRLFRDAIELALVQGADVDVVREMHHRIAQMYMSNYEPQMAQREMMLVLNRYGEHVMTHYIMGQAYILDWGQDMIPSREHLVHEALTHFQRAILLNGGFEPVHLIPDAYFNVGMSLYRWEGDPEAALPYLLISVRQYNQGAMGPLERSNEATARYAIDLIMLELE